MKIRQGPAIVIAALIGIVGVVITGIFTLAAASITRSPGGSPTPIATATIEIIQTDSGLTPPTPGTLLSIPTETSAPASATAVQSTSTLTPAPTATPPVEPTADKAVTVSPTSSTAAIADQPTRITARGTGAPSPTVSNSALRRRSAILAAEIDAKRQFAEWLNGAEIESVIVVTDGVLTIDEIRQVVRGTVPSGKKIDESFDETNDIAFVTLEWVVAK